jgi:hypothetical protein
MTTQGLTECGNCGTGTDKFVVADGYEYFTEKHDETVYECPTCKDTYEGSELAEDD